MQTVLYHSEPIRVARALTHLWRAVDSARSRDLISTVEVVLGDGSKKPVFDSAALQKLQSDYASAFEIKYQYFGQNLGTAKGHNTMFASCDSDFVVVMNPDVMMAPDCLIELFRPFRSENTGIVEARQMPIEHPKEYDRTTGETSWASTACCLIPSKLWRQIGGFDDATFFLYCDDVDFSWRARLTGYKVVFQPSAVVFHDKRLSPAAHWQTSSAEEYFSAEAALLLAHKYSRPDLVEAISRDFGAAEAPHFKKALTAFKTRKRKGKLCTPIDPEHLVGEFVQGEYANHRFRL